MKNTKMMTLVAFAAVMMSSTAAFAQWTVLAYSAQTGKWGRAQCANTYEGALDTALRACGDASCVRVAYARNGYVALATGQGGWGTGNLHGTQQDAERSSLARCSAKYANCAIKATGSSYNCAE